MSGSFSTAARAAIIDLDGTLVDTLGDFDAALNAALAELGLPPIARAAIRDKVGKGTPYLIRSVLAEVGGSADLYDALLARYLAHYGAINGRYADAYPGVPQGLQALKAAGLRLACLTNKYTALAKALLEAKGLAGYFDVVLGGDLFVRNKPDPLPLRKACEALGSTPASTLVIGDSSNDARAARSAGCPVVLVTYGYNHGEPVRAVDADAFVDSLFEAAALVRPGGPATPP